MRSLADEPIIVRVKILPMIAVQNPTNPPSVAPAVVHREIKQNQVHRYRIKLESGSEINPSRIAYTLLCKTEVGKETHKPDDIEFKLEDFSAETEGLNYHKKLTGGGKLLIQDLGLPDSIMDNLKSTNIWYPLLCFFLPSEVKDGAFEASEPVGLQARFHGAGKIEGNHYTFTGTIERDTTTLATLTLKWDLGLKGWPEKGEGTIQDANGTTVFSLKGR